MKKLTKMLSWLLSALVVSGVLLNPMQALASMAPNDYIYESSEIFINPLYEDVLDVEAEKLEIQNIIASQCMVATLDLGDEPTVYQTYDEALNYLIQQMVKRENIISLTIPGSLYTSYDGILNMFWNDAILHTEDGNGSTGDYLRWVHKGGQMSASGSASTTMTLNYTVTYYTTADQEQELTTKLNQVYTELGLSTKTDYEKVRAIHDYICDNVDYHHYNVELGEVAKRSAYDAIINHTCVCQGYASAFYRMCKDNGLSVRIVDSIPSENHGWNIVKIGDVYYNIDVTWDGQDAETRYTYFLKNQADFVGHTRSEEFSAASFNAIYPMSATSWVDYSGVTSGLNLDNLNYNFTTLDGSTVSSTASGKAKILVFFSAENPGGLTYSQYLINQIATGSFSDVDVIAVEVKNASQSDVNTFKTTYGNGSIAFSYDEASNNNNAMWAYIHTNDPGAGSISLPVQVYIDAANKIQYIEVVGDCTAEVVRNNINNYCNSISVTLSQSSVELVEGTSQKIIAKVNGEVKDATQFTWISDNNGVATVDQYGKVTAVAAGTCTITCKLNDTYKATLNVTVKAPENYTVTVTSRSTSSTDSVATVTGGGTILGGQKATVTAPKKNGYDFIGWYLNSYLGDAVSENLSYTFTVNGNTSLVAVYEAKANATLNVTGANYKVILNGGAAANQAGDYSQAIPLGTKVTLDATDNTNFLYWKNGSGDIISKNKTYTFTMVDNANITVGVKGAGQISFVEFLSSFGQVLAYSSYTAEQEITFPAAPSKMGYSFTNWDKDSAAIKTAITNSVELITVNPVYSQNSTNYTVTVDYVGTSLANATYTELQGTVVKLQAPSVYGKTFKCWAKDEAGTSVLGTDTTYNTRVVADTTIYAIYVDKGIVVEKTPVIAITNVSASAVGDVHKLHITATRSVPTGYTLVEQGMICNTTDNSVTNESLVLDGSNVKKFKGSDLSANNMFTLNFKVATDSTMVHARGYMVVVNDTTGDTEVIYTEIASQSYSSVIGG